MIQTQGIKTLSGTPDACNPNEAIVHKDRLITSDHKKADIFAQHNASVSQVAAAVGKQRGTRRATHKDHDRSKGLCRGWPGHLEQPPRRPADFITVH